MFSWLFTSWQPVQTRLIIGSNAFSFKNSRYLILFTDVTDVTIQNGFGRSDVVIHTFAKNYTAATFIKPEDAKQFRDILDGLPGIKSIRTPQ